MCESPIRNAVNSGFNFEALTGNLVCHTLPILTTVLAAADSLLSTEKNRKKNSLAVKNNEGARRATRSEPLSQQRTFTSRRIRGVWLCATRREKINGDIT